MALDSLGDQGDDHSPEWLDSLLEKMLDLSNALPDESIKKQNEEILQLVATHKQKFVKLGKKSFIMFINYLASGDEDKALKEFFPKEASAQDIIDGIVDDAINIEEKRLEEEQFKREVIEVIKVLAQGAKILLPLLLSVI